MCIYSALIDAMTLTFDLLPWAHEIHRSITEKWSYRCTVKCEHSVVIFYIMRTNKRADELTQVKDMLSPTPAAKTAWAAINLSLFVDVSHRVCSQRPAVCTDLKAYDSPRKSAEFIEADSYVMLRRPTRGGSIYRNYRYWYYRYRIVAEFLIPVFNINQSINQSSGLSGKDHC